MHYSDEMRICQALFLLFSKFFSLWDAEGFFISEKVVLDREQGSERGILKGAEAPKSVQIHFCISARHFIEK